ncbi:MAG TPA: hypothetical protein VN667_17975 [Burkholderiales bacterium]|nr:hypothetical protein [Burkholderiales bacterium]
MNAQISFLTHEGKLDGAVLRDAGIAQSAETNRTWIEATLPVLRRYCETHEEVTGELFRGWHTNAGGLPPVDHHAWGALMSRAVRKEKWLQFARFMPATSAKTHGHPIRVYTSLLFKVPA